MTFLLYAFLICTAWAFLGVVVVSLAFSLLSHRNLSKTELWIIMWLALPFFLWLFLTEREPGDPTLMDILTFLFTMRDNEAGDFSP